MHQLRGEKVVAWRPISHGSLTLPRSSCGASSDTATRSRRNSSVSAAIEVIGVNAEAVAQSFGCFREDPGEDRGQDRGRRTVPCRRGLWWSGAGAGAG